MTRRCELCGASMARAKLGQVVCGNCATQKRGASLELEERRALERRALFDPLWVSGLLARGELEVDDLGPGMREILGLVPELTVADLVAKHGARA